MSWQVLKFGGSSLADPVGRALALDRVLEARRPAVVVSALGQSTDLLVSAVEHAAAGRSLRAADCVDTVLALAEGAAPPSAVPRLRELGESVRQILLAVALLRECSPAARDTVLATGERLAAAVFAAALEERGQAALAVDGTELIRTNADFGEAVVDVEETQALLHAAGERWGAVVPVITGFVGGTATGRPTTLGRGGSDYSAALVAQGLGAETLQIWSDVPGVMSADPDLVAGAKLLERMSYGEALELATFGARVLHPRTLLPLMDSGIPMEVRDTRAPQRPGTVVDALGAQDETRATSVTSLEGQALIDLRFRRLYQAADLGERVHKVLSSTARRVWLVSHSAHGQALSVVVPAQDAPGIVSALETAFAAELASEAMETVALRQPVALLTLVAEAMGKRPNVAGRLFASLGQVGINVHSIGQSASARSISCVVDQGDLPVAVRTVHAAFQLDQQQASVFLLGTGVVGGALLRQLDSRQGPLRRERQLALQLVGVARSQGVAWSSSGLAPLSLQVQDRALGEADLDALAELPVPILVDCTAAEGMEDLYEAAFSRGIHVVAANKKALTLPLARSRRVHARARQAHRAWRYETTVGAALPVLSTLEGLLQTGDQVTRIVGSLSGTLGYLCAALNRGEGIDEAVRRAKELGYTEPAPQEDLAGTDAARKALILARHLGLELDLGDVDVAPLVPLEVLQIQDLEAFYEALGAERGALAARVAQARERGERLRYLATVEPGAARPLQVGAVAVGPEHPAFGLQGSQSMVAFWTERYAEHPLVVSGAGAGGEVTASGVLADIIRIAESLR